MHKLYRLSFVFCLALAMTLLLWAPVQAQTKLTDKDVDEIKSKARNNITELENLMNFVTFNSASTTEIQNVIERSYTASSNNHLFFNRKVVVEDDITPGFNKDNTKDLEADKYLNTLDVYYEKTADPSIHFTNIQVSNVKKKDYLYVKVLYESTFDSKYKRSTTKYAPKQRMAVIRADKIGYSWQTRIIGITFYDPFKPITSTENDVVVVNTNPYADEKQPDLSYEKNEIKPSSSSEQRPWNLGLKVGIASSAWAGETVDDATLGGTIGGVAGLYLRYYGKRYSHIGLGMDMLYISKGGSVVIDDSNSELNLEYKLRYMQVPVFITVFFVGKDRFKPYLNLGYAPAFLLAANARDKDSGEQLDQKSFFQSYDGSVLIGLGADFKVSPRNRMMFDMRFDFGPTNILKETTTVSFVEPDTIFQGAFSISLGYAFGL
jgi:hypothetical protein